MLDLLMNGFAMLLCLAVTPAVLYLLLLTVAGGLGRHAESTVPGWQGRIAIVVPAHNEAGNIGATLANLMAITRADGAAEVFVIADNCTDDTATLAREAGAQVLVRQDADRRGKGYALDFAFTTLLAGNDIQPFDAFLVVDADTLAEANLLRVLRQRFAQGVAAIQVHYGVLNASDSPRNRLAALALASFNHLRPRGRVALGWSSPILGNGFALKREVIECVPYTATSVVEDLEYQLRLVDAGIQVDFTDATTVRGEMPVAKEGQRNQRARWEGGRLRMLFEQGPRLFARIVRGEGRFVEPLLDLWLPPLALHAMSLLVLLMIPVSAARWVGAAGLVALVIHVFAAARINGQGAAAVLRVMLQVPGYLAWKLGMLRVIVSASRQSAQWVRSTRRHESRG